MAKRMALSKRTRDGARNWGRLSAKNPNKTRKARRRRK
jgi:hypothetical protein